MRQLISGLLLTVTLCGPAWAEDKATDKNTKSKSVTQLEGLITQPRIALEVREKMIADKELELAAKEKKLNEDINTLAVARKQLVQEALNVKAALNAREKELSQKAAASPNIKIKKKKYPSATKNLGDLINEVSEKNPVKDD